MDRKIQVSELRVEAIQAPARAQVRLRRERASVTEATVDDEVVPGTTLRRKAQASWTSDSPTPVEPEMRGTCRGRSATGRDENARP